MFIYKFKASKWDNVNIAVVEYQPLYNIFLNDEQNVAMNTQKYIEILKNITAETVSYPKTIYYLFT